ncbi:hypothetical protein [Kribbella sp. NBC_00889]|uniref:hypothetical protein n=1 Tax=Kribbella sp. NBC_00889 TaxID=2975974 RepID=UPI0038641495|nr:hypothetical protein OG817_12880 [Kribbella sp. NBC_00889]
MSELTDLDLGLTRFDGHPRSGRGVEADAGGVVGADDRGGPVGEAEDVLAGFGFGGRADEALAFDSGDGVGDVDGAGFEVDLGSQDGHGLADADAGDEHEGDEVGELALDGVVVCGDVFCAEGPLRR